MATREPTTPAATCLANADALMILSLARVQSGGRHPTDIFASEPGQASYLYIVEPSLVQPFPNGSLAAAKHFGGLFDRKKLVHVVRPPRGVLNLKNMERYDCERHVETKMMLSRLAHACVTGSISRETKTKDR